LRRFALLWPFFSPWRASLLVGFLSVAATQLAQVWIPLLTRNAFDALGGRPPDVSMAAQWALVFVLVTGIRGVFQYLMRLLLVSVSREMERGLRDRLYERLLRRGSAWFSRHHTGDILSRFTSDVEAVRMSAGSCTS
jgi:ATP-binding cassette subfamily B protein